MKKMAQIPVKNPFYSLPLFLLINAIATNSAEESLTRQLSAQDIRQRLRRQLDISSSVPQIDLNTTVPYIFSARLYPYGLANGDVLAQSNVQPLTLQSIPLTFLEKNYDTVYIHHDGLISLSPNFLQDPAKLPISGVSLIPVFWQKSRGGRVFYRETSDQKIVDLAGSEVNIQYRYGKDFQTKSVIVVTWEEVLGEKENEEKQNKNGNVFQIALILGENACFAHFVYSKLHTANSNPIAGFNGEAENSQHFSLPGSGTSQAAQLLEKSNIGIPGEWLFRIDDERIFLCGAGFQGLECVDSCASTQWYLDCSRTCHCADGNQCNTETGECPEGKCNPGWEGSPICDQDIDECAEEDIECPNEQPDCVNTPGAYLCLCFEYDNATNTCKGSKQSASVQKIPVPVMPLVPLLIPSSTPHQTIRRISTAHAVSLPPGKILNSSPVPVSSTAGDEGMKKLFEGTTSFASDSSPFLFSTFAPMTIRPLLGSRKPSTLSSPAPLPVLRNENDCSRCHQMAECMQGKCQCTPGWIGDGHNCDDLDECLSANACGLNAECQNTIGSYQCVCNMGFVATATGCVDVDECAEGMVQCGHGDNSSICINTMGGFECKCRSGYTGSPESAHGCVDIDECELSNYYCGEKATCTNTPGSFACDCFEGHEKAPNSNHCVDTDECLHSPCNSAATCTNMDGTFHCECFEGFVGNGVECHETILYPVSKTAIANTNNKEHLLIKFDTPLLMFGKKYSQAYVSPNGLISFDHILQDKLVRNPSELRSVNLLPFHLPFNPSTSGPIHFQQISSNSAEDSGLLTRASITIQNKFHEQNFRATSLYLITFDRMREVNLEKSNSFQVAIVQDAHASFVIFLYESLESSPRGVGAGISNSAGFMSVPVELLISSSNVGQGGKWIYRVDDQAGKIFTCPAGSTGAPLCQQDCPASSWGYDCRNQCRCADRVPCDFRNGFCSNGKCVQGFTGLSCYEDIDECASGTHKCHANATCLNLPVGSYTCKCNGRSKGNGFSCEAIDECFMRFNTHCAPNAHCDSTNPNYPECVCDDRFNGDGRRKCVPNGTTETTTPRNVVFEVSNNVSPGPENRESGENPFVMSNWENEESKNLNAHTKSTQQSTQQSTKMTTTTSRTPTQKTSNEINQEVYTSTVSEESATETSGMMMIVVPGVLFGVWLLLTVVIALICCCRKRRKTTPKKFTSAKQQHNLNLDQEGQTNTRRG